MNIKVELDKIKKLYKRIGEELVLNKENISMEIKSFEEKYSLELPKTLKEIYGISNGFEAGNIIGAYYFETVWLGISFCKFQECVEDYNENGYKSNDEFEYLNDLNDPSWEKCPQVNKAYKSSYKLKFATDNINLGGDYCIDFRPSILGKIGQIVFITRWGVKYISEDFDSFIKKSFVDLSENFEELKKIKIYQKSIKNIIIQNNVVLFKKYYNPSIGVEPYLKSNIMCFAFRNNCKDIVSYILNDLKYPLENFIVDAVTMNNEKLFNELLLKKINVNKITEKNSMLSLLTDVLLKDTALSLKAARILISKGANINHRNYPDITILDTVYWLSERSVLSDKKIEFLEKKGVKLSEEFYKEKYYEKEKV